MTSEESVMLVVTEGDVGGEVAVSVVSVGGGVEVTGVSWLVVVEQVDARDDTPRPSSPSSTTT